MPTVNDEPTVDDYLGHSGLVERVASVIDTCELPYVLGISGGWGSGKTSFLRKLEKHFEDTYHPKGKLNKKNGVHLIWFNPWHHQFESTPLIGLLHEMRRHFTLDRRFIEEAKKLTDVTVHTALSMLDSLAKLAETAAPSFKTSDILKRGQDYENENFQTALASQRFRNMLEATIRQIIGNGKMIIFIDDLDRCEGETAFKLLEALKLYLNTANCVYVLGLDRHHLEGNCAKSLAKEDGQIQRIIAREYLGKMFQGFFLLPTPTDTKKYVDHLLGLQTDENFRRLLEGFGVESPLKNSDELVGTLNLILPRNPRKIKAFVSSWKTYLEVVNQQRVASNDLNWRVTLLLHYLGQFEEPLFRRLEESPGFYNDVVVAFCRYGTSDHPSLSGIELPHGFRWQHQNTGASEAITSAPSDALPEDTQEVKNVQYAFPRTFYVAPLVNTLPTLSEAQIRVNMPTAGG
jgi:hypothetical protein